MMNEFNDYVRDCFSEAGDIVIKSMMGGYLVYFKGKLIGDICGDELFLKRTPTSDRLLADFELRYPYEYNDPQFLEGRQPMIQMLLIKPLNQVENLLQREAGLWRNTIIAFFVLLLT